MTKPQLESLLDALSGGIQWVGIFAALLTFGAAALGIWHMTSSRKLRAIEAAESKEREATRLAESEARRAEIARLTRDAEEARRGIAEAQARAAEAGEKAERERLERVKIEEKLAAVDAKYAPRRLTDAQIEKLTSMLSNGSGLRVRLVHPLNDQESLAYLLQLKRVLEQTGWKIDGPDAAVYTGRPVGLGVEISRSLGTPSEAGDQVQIPTERIPRAAHVLMHAFSNAGLQFRPGVCDCGAENVTLLVGHKP
jgi:hypothetical protein